jgi:hypothetical protein
MSRAPAELAAAPEPQRPRRRRRWLRWLLVLALLAVLARIALHFLLPWLCDLGLAPLGLRASFGRVSLSLLSLHLRVHELEVFRRTAPANAPASARLLHFADLEADVDAWALLRGRFVVDTVAIAGLEVQVARTGDGSLDLPAELRGAPVSAPVPPAAAPPAGPPAGTPRDFRLPFAVRSLRIEGARIRLTDPALPPPHELDLQLDGAARSIGFDDREGRVSLRASSPQALDLLRIEVTGTWREPGFRLAWQLAVRGLQPAAIAPYLEPAGIAPAAERLAADLGGRVDVARIDARPDQARATVTANARLTADSSETFAIDRAELVLDELGHPDGGTAKATLEGIRGRAATPAGGGVAAAGLLFRGAADADAAPPEPTPAAAGPGFALRSLTANVQQLAVRYREEGPAPLDLEARLPAIALGPCAWPPVAEPAPFSAVLELPGIAGRIAVQDGRLQLPTNGQRLTATLRAEGITLARLQQRLQALGIDGKLDGATLGLNVAADVATAGATTTIQASVRDLAVRHGDAALLLPLVQVRDLAIDGAAHRLRAGSVAITGPQLALRRDPDGTPGLLGLRFRPPPASPGPARPAEPMVEPTAAPAPAWQYGLAEFRWTGAQVVLTDAAVTPAQSLTLQDVEIELAQIRFGGPPAGSPARLRVRARVPPLLENLAIDASAAAEPTGLAATGTLALDGLRGTLLAPWLEALGVEPLLAQGSLAGALQVRVRRDTAAGLHLDGELRDLVLRDGDASLAGATRAAVEGLRLGGDLQVGSVEIEAPSLDVVREQDGSVAALGFRFLAPATVPLLPAAAAPTPPTIAPDVPATAGAAGTTSTAALERFVLTGAALRVHDRRREGQPPLEVGCDATLDRLQVGPGSAPFPFRIALRAGTDIGELTLAGEARLDPRHLEVAAEIQGAGLRTGPLAALLEPHYRVMLADGNLAARVAARAVRTKDGALALFAEVRDFVIRDGQDELLAVDTLRADVPEIRSDPLSVHVRELRLAGARGRIRQLPDGLAIGALALGPAAAPAAPPAVAGPPSAPLVLPRLRIDALDLDLGDLVFADPSAPADAEPLHLRARLATAGPWQTARDEIERSPPLPLRLWVQALPLCAGAELHADVQAFALAPHVDAKLRAHGIDTEALTRVWPGLAGQVRGTTRTGEFTATLSVDLDQRRRDASQYDLTRPITGEMQVRDVALRAAPGGEVLAGVAAVDVELRAVNLTTGDVLLRSVEIATPSFRCRQTAEGLHALGLLFPAAPAAPSAAPPVPEPAAPVPAASPATSPAEVAIDTLLLSGVDFAFRDETTTPPTDLPFDSLEIEVRNLGTRALGEPVPIRFTAFLRGAALELPERHAASSLVAGLLGSTAKALTGGGDQKLERRPLCDEVSLQGTLRLFPLPSGKVQLGISRLELLSIGGLARAGRVEIGDGLLDAGVTLDMHGGVTTVTSNFVFQHLSLSEPPGGPISTYLKLPAPLDTVLFALRDDQGQHQIPFSFSIAQGKVDRGEITASAVGAIGSALTDALSRAVFRASGVITGLFGIGGGDDDLAALCQVVAFAPGEAELPHDLAALDEILARFAGDDRLALVLTHEVGPADAERCHALANPDANLLPALVARLRQKHDEQAAERAREAAETSALFQAGQTQLALEAATRLRVTDEDLAATSTALGRLLQQLRPGAERSATKRTRAACLEVAALRLSALQKIISTRVGPDAAKRIELRSPRFQPRGEGGGRVGLALRRRMAG